MVLLCAAEAVCDLAPALDRALAQRSPCPERIEELLFEVFNDFRSEKRVPLEVYT